MNRLTFGQIRQSTIPQALGLCAADAPGIAAFVNEATQRLLFAGGETGWYGTWAKMAFNVDAENDPYITLPRSVARLQMLDVCHHPVAIQNEWYEFLEFGIGLQPANACQQPCALLETYDRGVVITAVDLADTPQTIRAYATSSLDYGKRVLIQGLDQNDASVWNLDGINRVEGEFLSLAAPFTDSVARFSELTGIQKDVTYGPVRIYEVDPDTDEQTLLLTMEPSETLAGYRRYFLNGLPDNCCENSEAEDETVQVTAMAKLEFVPVSVDTDYCLIGNLPALKEECKAVRYEDIDNPNAVALAGQYHLKAIQLLNQELTHYMGRTKPAIGVHPFGSARLEYSGIGTLI